MNQYKVSDFLEKTFDKEPWWTFMGKYFGFPECCIDTFCNSEVREDSLFNGTGYVPCPCCNKKFMMKILKMNLLIKSTKIDFIILSLECVIIPMIILTFFKY